METKPKVIIVTGGSKGLGKGLVEGFLKDGDIVATFSRSKTPVIEEMLQKNPDKFYWEAIDASDFEKTHQFMKTVYNKFGRIDCLINNAGTVSEGVLTLMNPDVISTMIDLNFVSTIRNTRSCLKYMLAHRGGCIINISSINGVRGRSGIAVYSATKAGLDGFTRSLAREVGARGIRVNSVAPGFMETDLTHSMSEKERIRITRRTPLGRLGTVEDTVDVIKFLISDQARFVTGQTIVVDGGNTI